ncbi:chitinase class I domain-containing protein [Ditylenchus destructor]|uniref:Chitinase class I domain-containing protein n=1 Tax=Ditylenchus destructor TaxID=166010 RepID=A0AAD4N115_9BILA|nr:chitinase class I domain-containing protein [Ditylenchus destructor]
MLPLFVLLVAVSHFSGCQSAAGPAQIDDNLILTGNEPNSVAKTPAAIEGSGEEDGSGEDPTLTPQRDTSGANCPSEAKYGSGPPANCQQPTDPNNRPKSGLEAWFTKEMFSDLFPYANIGWGPNACFPYSYEGFVIAARYFPGFGTTSPQNGLSEKENTRRDVATFLAHAIQETGLNDISLYSGGRSEAQADNCFYRGGLFNWFEGGPVSAFLNPSSPGYQPKDGDQCYVNGRYCSPSEFYPCGNGTSGDYYESCYFGRGAIQISYNYNYGQFQDWLATQNIHVDLLTNPNLVMTSTNPPLALMASLWFYMTPQPPKPAMHDIILGRWVAGSVNEAAGYSGPIFGPTSLVINNECMGEDPTAPGGGGENRRIRAFKWFSQYYDVPVGNETTLTCKGMPQRLDQIPQNVSYQPDWSTTWKDEPCQCAPASYGGNIPYFQPGYYPQEFVDQNSANQERCVSALYSNPASFNVDRSTSPCLNHPPASLAQTTSQPSNSQSSTTAS